MSWLLLPSELRLVILQYHLTSPETIDHAKHLDNLVFGDLEVLISTRNTDLVVLVLEACKKYPHICFQTRLTVNDRLQDQHIHHQSESGA